MSKAKVRKRVQTGIIAHYIPYIDADHYENVHLHVLRFTAYYSVPKQHEIIYRYARRYNMSQYKDYGGDSKWYISHMGGDSCEV